MFILNNLKCYKSVTFSSTNHRENLIAPEQHTNFFSSVRESTLLCLGVCFFEFLTPSTFGGCNFFNSNSFLMIFSAPDVSTGRVQVLFKHQKQWSLPLNLACPECLNVRSPAILCYTKSKYSQTEKNKKKSYQNHVTESNNN